MRISDWSSDVCSSDLRFRDDTAFDEYGLLERLALKGGGASNFGCWQAALIERNCCRKSDGCGGLRLLEYAPGKAASERTQIVVVTTAGHGREPGKARRRGDADVVRSEEHTSELQSLMRISYAVFCLKKKKQTQAVNTCKRS